MEILRDRDPIAFMNRRADALAQRSADLKNLADAWRPLYQSLTPDQKRRMEIWKRGRSPGDERPKDYLRREMKQRVEAGAARFLFQAQFHLPAPGDTLDWYNAGVDWPVLSHPWHDIAIVTLCVALVAVAFGGIKERRKRETRDASFT